MRIVLIGDQPENSVVVEWDPEAGTFTGEGDGVLQVRTLVERAKAVGWVVTHPWPSVYPCVDPQHNPRDLALVLSSVWHLPDELDTLLPKEKPAVDGRVY